MPPKHTNLWVILTTLAISAPALAQDTAAGPRAKVKAATEARKAAQAKSKEAVRKTAAGAEGAAEARKEAKEARGDAKEARKEAKEARKEALEKRMEGLSPEQQEALKKRIEERRKTHVERRKKRRETIREKWGEDALKHPRVRAAMKVHAWRVARLQRIRAVAEAQGKTEVVARVDKLLAKETTRHEKHLGVLAKKPEGAPAEGAAATEEAK